MDLLREHPAHHRAAVLERDGRMMGDGRQQRALVVRERRVAVTHELADLAPLPAQRQPNRMNPRPALRPGNVAVLEHESRPRRADRFHRRLHDRLQRLLEVERLGNGLGDTRKRLELRDAALCLRIQLSVDDRVRDLGGDRDQEIHFVAGELARGTRSDVEGARKPVARRVDGVDRLREQPKVALARVHESIVGSVLGAPYDSSPMSTYDWLLFFHVTGAFLLIGGTVVAGVLTLAAIRRERPSEIAALLGLIRISLPFIYAGVALTLVFGLWLVHEAGQGYSYGDAWVIAAIVRWILANAPGGAVARRQEEVRQLALRLSTEGDVASPELRARLVDPVALALSFASGLAVFAVLVLMIWKPGS